MEKQHSSDMLMKVRSHRSVIAAGFSLYTGAFRKIFKSTWLTAVTYALAVSVTGTLVTTQLTSVLLQLAALPEYKDIIIKEHALLLTATAVLFLVGLFLLVLCLAAAGIKLKEHKDTGAVTMPPRWLAAPGKGLFTVLAHIAKAALRHWLLTLAIAVIGTIVITPVVLILCLPALVLTIANINAQAGMLMGDALGMPSYLTALSVSTWFLAGFLQAYILMVLLFIGYYAYGSAETRKKEREQQKLNIPS